ncbi:MAG TPA: hypothetical protein DCY79_22895 [Planctomycetaceae bacterium]|nr:hypothetical protein [Blastopirellula sp.]HAY82666.1 hypothetical protein [Planctomycetaceae bacterium]
MKYVVIALLLPLAVVGDMPAEEAGKLSFSADVLPILAENCFVCHGFDAQARQADLRLDTREGVLATDGVVVPGQADASELVQRIESVDSEHIMPPPDSGKRLTRQQKATLRRWIEEGAEYAGHWSFTAPEQVTPPEVAGTKHPIDRFLRSRLLESGLAPAPLASPATLIRRVSLDLTGLPPTPEQVDTFLVAYEQDAERAWQSLVQRLLQSPHYGERWGRWWLDQARYADSNGYSIDSPRSIWKYRDWVVAALNDDMPFDQFTIEQLAGDLLPNATNANRVATGFHRNTQINQEGGIDREQYRVDSIFDRVATTGTVWLGLTIGCAQCHDHKFDPIQQKEFYQLFAFLNNQDEPNIKAYAPDVDVAALQAERKQSEDELRELMRQVEKETQAWEAKLTDEARKKLSGDVQKVLGVARAKRNLDQQLLLFAVTPHGQEEKFQALAATYRRCHETLNGAPTTMVLSERSSPRKTHIFIKGDFTRPAEEVFPSTPSVLHDFQVKSDQPNRLDLARWIVRRDNPLTARVIVNRIWQQHFGAGLVATENDFGLLGSRPSHPQLLDWLAVEFMQRGWSLKAMHELIVTSYAYRQSSKARAELVAADADNRLLGRQTRLRLDAELVRDVALTASGLLAPKLGGPPVFPPIPTGVMSQGQVNRAWRVSEGEDRYRRGIYTFLYRATPPPSMSVFDAPDGYSTCTRRTRSNTPLQSLTLMNDAAFFEFAQALAKRIDSEGLTTAFRRCTSRFPDREELAVLERLDSLTAARVMLSLDETITRE